MKSQVMWQQSLWGRIQHNYFNNKKKRKEKVYLLYNFFFNTILLVPKKTHKFLWTQWKQMNICLRFLWIVLIFCSVFLHDIIYMLYNIYSITFIALCVIYIYKYMCMYIYIYKCNGASILYLYFQCKLS